MADQPSKPVQEIDDVEPLPDEIEHDNEKILYHYTDAAGLEGILRSQQIHASSLDYVNDPQEIEAFYKALLEALSKCLPRPKPSLLFKQSFPLESIYRHLEDQGTIGAVRRATFSVSFSADGDVLSQWRAYASGGLGFAVGFKRFNETLQFLRKDLVSLHPRLIEVKYKPEDISSGAEIIAGACQRIYELAKSKDKEIDSIGFNLIATSAALIGSCYKRPGFFEEREWRILMFDGKSLGDSCSEKVRTRVARGAMIPYVPIRLLDQSGHLPIARIVVGPRNDFRKAKAAVNILLRENGYGTSGVPMPEVDHASTSIT